MRLQTETIQSRFQLRTRTRTDGICTIEAATLLLQEVGAGAEVTEGMMQMLEALNASVLEATGKAGKQAWARKGDRQAGRGHGRALPLPSGREQRGGEGDQGEGDHTDGDRDWSGPGSEGEGEWKVSAWRRKKEAQGGVR